jgi:hypothetical protein
MHASNLRLRHSPVLSADSTNDLTASFVIDGKERRICVQPDNDRFDRCRLCNPLMQSAHAIVNAMLSVLPLWRSRRNTFLLLSTADQTTARSGSAKSRGSVQSAASANKCRSNDCLRQISPSPRKRAWEAFFLLFRVKKTIAWLVHSSCRIQLINNLIHTKTKRSRE